MADATGMRETTVDAAEHADIASIFDYFIRKFPVLETHRKSALFALNSEFAQADTPVHEGDEVAFFPPVSGG